MAFWGHVRVPPDQVTGCERDSFLTDHFLRATLSRRSWVDVADKVTKHVRLKLSESIWVSDLKGDFQKTLCAAFHSEILPPALWDRAFAPLGTRATPPPSVPPASIRSTAQTAYVQWGEKENPFHSDDAHSVFKHTETCFSKAHAHLRT